MPHIETLQQLVANVGKESALKLILMFQKDVEKHIKSMQENIDNNEPINDLRFHSHSLKGLCRTYGAQIAGDAAQDLQIACDNNDKAEIILATKKAFIYIPADAKAAVNFVQTLTSKST